MSRRLPTAALVLVVPILALAAILVTRAVAGPSGSAAAATRPDTVVIKNFAFAPATVTVARGATVEVTNDDGTAHTWSARNGAFDTGILSPGQHTTVTMRRSGSFAVFCKIHNSMSATVVVK